MEWVETTGKSVDEAKEIALDRLGIGLDDAEFEIIEEPRTGLFGRMRGEARVRARVKPATVRPKHDRRQRRRTEGKGRNRGKQGKNKRKNGPGQASESTPNPAEGGSLFRRLLDWWRGRRARMNEVWEKLQEEAQKKNRL